MTRIRQTIVLVASIAALLAPCAVRAGGLNYTPPEGYRAGKSPPTPPGVLFYRGWIRDVGSARYYVFATARPAPAQGAAVFDEIESHLRADGATGIVRKPFGRCGGPGMRLSYARPDRRAYVLVTALAGGRLVAVTFSHPLESPADARAVATLDTLCTGTHQEP